MSLKGGLPDQRRSAQDRTSTHEEYDGGEPELTDAISGGYSGRAE